MSATIEWAVLCLACFGTVLWCKRTDDRRQST